MAEDRLSPLETHALRWTLLCEQLGVDPQQTTPLDVVYLFRKQRAKDDPVERRLPDEESHYSCTRGHCQEDDPFSCWAAR